MKILLTGSSGFLGNFLMNEWKLHHEIITIGRKSSADIQCEISASVPSLPKADMVVHAAGKAHSIPRNENEGREFFNVNVNGTLNLLSALEENRPDTFVFISSVAVYGLQSGENINEQNPLLAKDPYGKSKIEAEREVLSWGLKHGVKIIILRLPLIIGPNPPGNLGAMKKAIKGGYYFRIGKGNALRSVVTASDVAKFIPQLLNHEGIYNLSGRNHPSISEIDSLIAATLHKKVRFLPDSIAKVVAATGDVLSFFPFNSIKLNKLTNSLTFSSQLAVSQAGWNPHPISMSDFE